MAPVISQSSSDGKRQAVRLCESDPAISEIQFLSYIVAKAGTAWLKNEEVLAILEFFVEKRTDPALIFPDVAGRWRTPGMSSSFNFVPLQSQLAGLGHCHSLAVSPSRLLNAFDRKVSTHEPTKLTRIARPPDPRSDSARGWLAVHFLSATVQEFPRR
jgi:hypothetical protein